MTTEIPTKSKELISFISIKENSTDITVKPSNSSSSGGRIWVTANDLKKELTIHLPKHDVIVYKNLSSDKKVTITANNILVLGKVLTTGDFNLNSEGDILILGSIKGENVNVISKKSVVVGTSGQDQKAENIFAAVGIHYQKLLSGGYTIHRPNTDAALTLGNSIDGNK